MVKKRAAYSVETKNKAVEMKLQRYSTKQIMQELNIKNETQVETWFRWYKNGETHRFHQQIGKTIFLRKRNGWTFRNRSIKIRTKKKRSWIRNIKKIQGTGKEVSPQVVVKLVEELKDKYAVHLICSCLSDTEKYFKAISGYDTCGDCSIDVKKIE